MATIRQLQAQLRSERVKLEAKRDIQKIGVKRKSLQMEINRTRRERKFGGLFSAGRTAGKAIGTAGRTIGTFARNIQDSRQNPVKPMRKKRRSEMFDLGF